MLEFSDFEFKTSIINMLKALVDNMVHAKQMGHVNREKP